MSMLNEWPGQAAAVGAVDRGAVLLLARELYTERRRRSRYFDTDLFGEPSWDILLDLYIAACEDRRVPTTSACIGAHVPPTTALRWLRLLEARGLVEREHDGRDGRRTFVGLSARGMEAMEAFLGSTRAKLLLELATFAEAEAIAAVERHAAE